MRVLTSRMASASFIASSGLCFSKWKAIRSADRIPIPALLATAAVHVVPEVIAYAVALTQATRDARAIALGAGTRGAISLLRMGKAFAALDGRDFVTPDDIKRAQSLPAFGDSRLHLGHPWHVLLLWQP